jgi:outer membrane protein
MSASERDKLERDLVSDKREFKRKQDQFRDDVNFKQNELVGNLQRKLVGSIRSYATANGFDLLLAEGVIYTSDALNITSEVLAHLRKDAK